MRKLTKQFACFILLLFAGALVLAQEGRVDRATVPFSDPSKPGMVEASVHYGSITVKGYEGKEVIVEARLREKLLTKKKAPEKAKGMRLIQVAVTGLTIEERNNKMEIGVSSVRNTVDLEIQVPYSTSLELGGHNKGDITVEKVSGEIEVARHNGSLRLTDVSGAIVAHTYNGEILVTFLKVDPEKPMSFSTYNGDIDVTFPPAIKADVKMSSQQGDIYSDFEVSMKRTPQKVEDKPQEKGERYRISFDRHIYGSINGGGPEFHFKTYHGDIFIRKGK